MNSKIAQEFADLKFVRECSDIVLTQKTDKPLIITGSGELWQDEHGQLKFKIYVKENLKNILDYFYLTINQSNIGQLVPESNHFRLEADAFLDQDKWISESVHINFTLNKKCIIVRGNIDKIHKTSKYEDQNKAKRCSVISRYVGEVKYPVNSRSESKVLINNVERSYHIKTDVAVLEYKNLSCELRHESNHTVVGFSIPVKMYSNGIYLGIRDALQFSLGRELKLLSVETVKGGEDVVELFSIDTSEPCGVVIPPLLYDNAQNFTCWSKIFWSYYLFVTKNPVVDLRIHPISIRVNKLFHESLSYVENVNFALANNIEGLINEYFGNIKVGVDENYQKLSDEITSFIRRTAYPKDIKARAITLIKNLVASSESKRVDAFLREVDMEDQFKIWKKIRHPGSHGARKEVKIEESLACQHKLFGVLYEVVLRIIQYSGERTDYAAQSWPTVLVDNRII